MAYDVGVKIGMDGEAEFRKSLQNINQQMKTLGSEMKAVTAEFQSNEDSMEALSAKADVLNRSIQANANQMRALTAQYNSQVAELEKLRDVLDMATKEFGENSQEVARAQNAYNKQAATVLRLENDINKSRTTMAQYKSQLAQVERQMDGTADITDDMADATEKAGDAADNAAGRFGSFQVALGNLISSGIQAAISAVGNFVGALVNLDETTEEYRRAQGRLNTAFEAAGYGADTAQKAYQAFYGILGDTDTATEASQLLAQLADSEEDVVKWTEIAAGVSGTFGDSLPIEGLIEAANETAKVGEVTGTLADALNWVGISEDDFNTQLAACSTEAERNQLIMNTLAGRYDEASEAFYRNNEALVASRNAQAQMDASLATLGESISNIKTRLAAELTPALSGVIEAFNGVLNGESGSGIALSGAITELVNSVVAMLPDVLSAGAQVVGALVTGITQSIPSILAAGGELIGQLVAGVSEALPELIASAPAAVEEFLGSITEQLPRILEMGVEIQNSMVDGILEAIPNMVAQLPQIITSFIQFISDNLPSIIEAGINILLNLVTGIINAIPDLVASLPKVITAITGGIADNLPKIIQSGFDLLLKLIDGILSAIPDLVAALPQIINAIIEGIGALMGGIVDIGESIIQGVWQGIQNMAGWITQKVTGFFSGIVDSVKGLLGIHSPSTVFAGMGKNMALGLGEGFGDEMRSVQNSINRSMAELSGPELNAAYNVSTAASGGGAAQYQDSTASAIAAAVQSALQGAAVYLNGRRVGSLITQQQNASAVARGQSQVYL